MVAGGGLAVAGLAVRHELGTEHADRRERGDDRRDREERHESGRAAGMMTARLRSAASGDLGPRATIVVAFSRRRGGGAFPLRSAIRSGRRGRLGADHEATIGRWSVWRRRSRARRSGTSPGSWQAASVEGRARVGSSRRLAGLLSSTRAAAPALGAGVAGLTSPAAATSRRGASCAPTRLAPASPSPSPALERAAGSLWGRLAARGRRLLTHYFFVRASPGCSARLPGFASAVRGPRGGHPSPLAPVCGADRNQRFS
jgi:hypothetical protein